MGSCAAPSAKGDDKFITTDYLQQCRRWSMLNSTCSAVKTIFLWLKECWLQMTVTGPGRGLHFRATSGQRSAAKCRCPFPAGHCINVTLSYTFVSGPHGPAAGKFFNRVQQFSLLTDRIALQDRRYWRISGPSNAGIHFIHL
ncbi:hypothetical protein E5N88_25800 (plasmid) [Salmonella enterica subsp. enterica serovar 1,4,[5],12:i:-]|nr:hypothetical protein E5N88_25800 [Salmonella enterica subsp. enterica serovar 1,4,[5],12:i:-]